MMDREGALEALERALRLGADGEVKDLVVQALAIELGHLRLPSRRGSALRATRSATDRSRVRHLVSGPNPSFCEVLGRRRMTSTPLRLRQPRMLTARETIRPIVTSETSDWTPMMLLAMGVSGIVSVGEKAVALVSETYR